MIIQATHVLAEGNFLASEFEKALHEILLGNYEDYRVAGAVWVLARHKKSNAVAEKALSRLLIRKQVGFNNC